MLCQTCRVPLHLDSSLSQLNAVSFKLLAETSAAPSALGPPDPLPSFQNDRREEYYRAMRDLSNGPSYNRTAQFGPSVTSSTELSRSGQNDFGSMSFVVLSESQVIPSNAESRGENSMSTQMELTNKLFDALSSRSDIDHPVCSECGDVLIKGLRSRLNAAYKERDAYIAFLRQANLNAKVDEEMDQARQALQQYKTKYANAQKDLEALEDEERRLQAELTALEDESRALDKEEEQFWENRNSYSRQLQAFRGESDRLASRYDHDNKQLLWLQRTNVYNDTFCIGYDGDFGTINGLRLGRLQECPVDWSEINAAWGQACLLLAILAEKIGYAFVGYRLNPMGSHSTIDKIDYPVPSSVPESNFNATNPPSHSRSTQAISASSEQSRPVGSQPRPKITTYTLFYTGDSPLRFTAFTSQHFNNAMIGFLECLRQLGKHVEQNIKNPAVLFPHLGPSGNINTNPLSQNGRLQPQPPSQADGASSQRGASPSSQPSVSPGAFRMPYEIENDTINRYSIRVNSGSWTAACRCTLLSCKYLLAYASHHSVHTEAENDRHAAPGTQNADDSRTRIAS